MKSTFKQLDEILVILLKGPQYYPIMIRGRHGSGKSEYVYQVGQSLGLQVVERRTSQMTEGDILGMPIVDLKNDFTTWKLPDWYIECCNYPRLLFLDEIDRASIEVRQAIFELGDSRKISGHILHEKTLLFAACNGGEYAQAQSYQVGSMDPAELSRWYVIELDPSITDWIEWATENNINEDIIDYVQESQVEGKNVLEYSEQFEENKVYPSRRSWVRLSNVISNYLTDDKKLIDISREIFTNFAYGFLGTEIAISFDNFIRSSSRKEAYEKIIVEGDTDFCDSWTTTQHMLFINRIIKSGMIKKLVSSSIINNLGKYYMKLSNELGIKLWSSLGDSIISNTKSIENDIAIYNFYRFNKVKIDDRNLSFHFIEQFTPATIDELTTEDIEEDSAR